MSKKKTATAPRTATKPDDGYVRVSDDIDGFWDGTGTAHFTPTGLKTFKSKTFRDRMSTIIFARALSPVSCMGVATEDSDGESFVLEAGGKLGIWYKPGMKQLLNLAGSKVKMTADGEKDVGKGNPMKLFAIDVARGSVMKKLPDLSTPETRNTPSHSSDDDLPDDYYDDMIT